MMDRLFNGDDAVRLVTRYQQLHQIGWKLNNEILLEYLPKQAYETCGKKLGIWRRGTLVLERDDVVGVLADYCIHNFHPMAGNAVEQYVADSPPDPGSDEYAVLTAMLESFHTLVQVTEVLPRVGVRVTDLLTDCGYLLIDMGFSKTARKGMAMATRILPYGEFVTTSGAALPVDEDTLREIRDSILPRHRLDKDGRCTLNGGRRKADDLAAAIMCLCLQRGASSRVRYVDTLPPRH